MNSERFQHVRTMYEQAQSLPETQRRDFVLRACGDDPSVASEVLELLAARLAAGSFMQEPAAGLPEGANLREPADSADPWVGRRLGQYHITAVLGRGGMGVVYKAEQDRPRRTVALKLIRSSLMSESLLRRFEHEAQILGRLNHPAIAQIYETGSLCDQAGHARPYFAMEYVHGPPLLEYAQQQHLTTHQKLALFAVVCDAVEHAHQKGVVHRDLKPANILVESTTAHRTDAPSGAPPASAAPVLSDAGARPKVLDFGVARVTDMDLSVTTMQTQTGAMVGTLQYMSPEQVRGDTALVDTRSDVYALGVVLFELLTGSLPYDVRGKPIPQAAAMITRDESTPLGSANRAFRGDIETIVAKAMEKEPSRRYQSAAALAADIRRYLADLPIMARPPTASYQLTKFARRHKTLVAGVAATILALIAGVVGTSIGLIRARGSAKQAVESLARFEKTNRYLKDTIGWFRPGKLRGSTVSLKDVLGSVAGRIDKELADEPQVAAFMHQSVGDDYLALGEADLAEHHARRSLECWTAREPESDGALQAIELEISVHKFKGDFTLAEAPCRKVLEILGRGKADTDPRLIKARINLGAVLRGQRRTDEAGKELELALASLHKASEPDPAALTEAANELAMLLRRSQPQRALDLMHEALQAARRAPEVDDEGIAALTNNLATAVKDNGDLKEAERLYRESLELRRKIYGEDHVAVALVINNIGTVQVRRGDLLAAEQSFTKALEMRRACSALIIA